MLRKAYLEITNICNLSCSFCPGTKREKRFMSAEDFSILAAKLRPHTEYLYLHLMGEPLLHPEFEDCDREAQTVTLRFPLHDWEVNGIGTLHGGIMSCAADLTISLLLHYFADSEIPPTVSMTTNYIRPVPMKGSMLVKARMTSLGRTMGTGYCEIIIPESGKVAATVVATFAIPRKKTE